MFSGPKAFWRNPPRPMAGVALAGVAGILLATGAQRLWPGLAGDPRPGVGLFFVVAGAFFFRPSAGWFWPLVVAGYGALYGLQSAPVPALRLASLLTAESDPARPRVVHAVGTVIDVPRDTTAAPTADRGPLPDRPASGPRWRATLALESAEIDGVRWSSHARVSLRWRDGLPALAAGQRLALVGTAVNFAEPRNPGEFDVAAWRRGQGVFSEIRAQGLADVRLLPPVAGPSWARWQGRLAALAGRCHDAMARVLARDLDDSPDERAVTTAAVLGLRGDPELGDDLENLLQRTGTLHYFAVDGLKLGLLAALCLRLFSFAGVNRGAANLLVLPLLFAYALATGLGPASARAVFVAAIVAGGLAFDRPARPGNSLGAGAALLLLWDTRSLFELGFQLTFLVVLAILVLFGPLSAWLRRFGAPDAFVPPVLLSPARRGWERVRVHALDLLAVSLAAWVGSLPIMLLDFGWVSPVSPVANVCAFPFAFGTLALGLLSLAGGWLWAGWSVWMNNANWLVARLFLGTVRLFDALPGGSAHVGDPRLWHLPAPSAELTILDTSGQGFTAHLRTRGGGDWLIDTGRRGGLARVARPYLQARAVRWLDGGLLLTQADTAHAGGAAAGWEEWRPARVLEGAAASARSPAVRALRGLLAARREVGGGAALAAGAAGETFVRRGDAFAPGPGARVSVLYPPPDPPKGRHVTAADRALAFRMDTAEGWRVLWLADGGNGEPGRWLLAHAAPDELRCDVLVSAVAPTPLLRRVAAPTWVFLQDRALPPAEGAGDVLTTTTTEEVAAGTFSQQRSGALTLLLYPHRMEARGFVDGRREVRAGGR